jgi:hypothetical protein
MRTVPEAPADARRCGDLPDDEPEQRWVLRPGGRREDVFVCGVEASLILEHESVWVRQPAASASRKR